MRNLVVYSYATRSLLVLYSLFNENLIHREGEPPSGDMPSLRSRQVVKKLKKKHFAATHTDTFVFFLYLCIVLSFSYTLQL